MSNLASDSFTGTNGAAWSSTWTTGLTPTGGTAAIQSNAGRLTTGTAGGYAGASRISRLVNITAPVDAVAVFKFKWSTGDECYPRFYIRSTNTALDAQGGYYVELNRPGNEWTIGKGSSYSNTTLGTVSSYTFTSNTFYWVRFGIVGTALKARIWADGGSEPGTWDLTATDSAISSAGSGCGFSLGPGNTGNAKWDVDDFSLDTAFPANAFTGSAGVSGSGTLTATGVPTPVQSVALSGSGTLTVPGSPNFSATCALSGSGTLTASGTPSPTGAVALSGSGTLSPLATTISASGSAALSGSGTLSGTGTPAASGTAALSGSGTLVTTGSAPMLTGSAAFSGSGTLTGSGTAGFAGAASLSGDGSLAAAGSPALAATAALSGSGELEATGAPWATGTASLSGTGELSASGVPGFSALCALSGSGSLTASGSPSPTGSVSLSGSGTLTQVSLVNFAVLCALQGDGDLSGVFMPSLIGSVLLAGSGELDVEGIAAIGRPPTRGLVSTGTRSAGGPKIGSRDD